MTRLYYTCPIKALYMMKEFGVKTYMEAKIIASCNLTTGEITKGGVDIFSFEEYFDDILGNDLEALNNNDIKIYVATESEHIFEPKEGDKDENGLFFDGRHWTDGFSYAISLEQSKTSFRFGKQFFMPEVEK
jgi:hypothetical protein